MKTTKAILLFSLVLSSVFFIPSACKKEGKQTAQIDYCSMDTSLAGLAEWAFFKQGSYWVYRDLVSGRSKRMFVDQAYYFIDRWGKPGFTNKLRTSGMEGGYGWGYSSDSERPCRAAGDCRCKGIVMLSTESGDMNGAETVLPYFHFAGQKFPTFIPIGEEPDFSVVESTNDSLEFMGNKYTDLVRVHMHYHPCSEWTEARFWWKKNLGLVRFDYIELNEIWMLVDYNVQQ